MKKFLAFMIAFCMITVSIGVSALAEDVKPFLKGSTTISIYEPGTTYDDGYSVDYEATEQIYLPADKKIILLMINGAFIPDASIIIKDDRTLVPVRLISETLGAKVDWDQPTKTVTITTDENEVVLILDTTAAIVNGEAKVLDVPATAFNESTYVPLRFIGEALGAEVQYIPTLAFAPTAREELNNVSCVIVDKAESDDVAIDITEALKTVKAESQATYDMIKDYVGLNGVELGSEGYPDYDPNAILYTTKNFGRYYIFVLATYEKYPIFFNKYTGEILSQNPGLPFLNIDNGFPRLGFLYQ